MLPSGPHPLAHRRPSKHALRSRSRSRAPRVLGSSGAESPPCGQSARAPHDRRRGRTAILLRRPQADAHGLPIAAAGGPHTSHTRLAHTCPGTRCVARIVAVSRVERCGVRHGAAVEDGAAAGSRRACSRATTRPRSATVSTGRERQEAGGRASRGGRGRGRQAARPLATARSAHAESKWLVSGAIT